jgi:hypothetical protein
MPITGADLMDIWQSSDALENLVHYFEGCMDIWRAKKPRAWIPSCAREAPSCKTAVEPRCAASGEMLRKPDGRVRSAAHPRVTSSSCPGNEKRPISCTATVHCQMEFCASIQVVSQSKRIAPQWRAATRLRWECRCGGKARS